jgi:hypothetical protein
MELDALVNSVLELGSRDLESEEAAIATIVKLRWPSGVFCRRCGAACIQDGVHFKCRRRRCGPSFTVFVDTALGALRRPRVRAILLALRAMATSKRGISAMELARETGTPHVSLWRHMHLLRRLLPERYLVKPGPRRAIQVCGRRAPKDWVAEFPPLRPVPASLRVVRDACGFQILWDADLGHDKPGGREGLLVGQTVRTWLNGTFHGVRWNYLSEYATEISARLAFSARDIVSRTLRTLFATKKPPARDDD